MKNMTRIAAAAAALCAFSAHGQLTATPAAVPAAAPANAAVAAPPMSVGIEVQCA